MSTDEVGQIVSNLLLRSPLHGAGSTLRMYASLLATYSWRTRDIENWVQAVSRSTLGGVGKTQGEQA